MKKSASFQYVLFLAISSLFLWSCSTSYDIKLKNGTTSEIHVTTRRSGEDGKVVEDTLTLRPGDAFKVGECEKCTEISTQDVQINQMLLTMGIGIAELELNRREDVVYFLNRLESDKQLVKDGQLVKVIP